MSSRPAPPSNKPMGQTTADYGASLREDVRARKMTNAQAQAAHNAFVKAQLSERGVSPASAAALQSAQSMAAQGAKPKLTRGFFGTTPSTSQQPVKTPMPTTAPPARDIIATKPAPPKVAMTPEQAYQNYVGQQQNSSGGNLLGALRPGVKSPTPSTSQQPSQMVAPRPPSMVAPRPPVDPGFAIDRPSTGGVKPGMSLAPTQTGSMAASGPMAAPAAAARMKKGGTAKASKPVKKMAKGGSTASSRGDGCAVRGKTKGMMR